MLLAINANNTNTVFAVYDGPNLRGAWRCATEPKRTEGSASSCGERVRKVYRQRAPH